MPGVKKSNPKKWPIEPAGAKSVSDDALPTQFDTHRGTAAVMPRPLGSHGKGDKSAT